MDFAIWSMVAYFVGFFMGYRHKDFIDEYFASKTTHKHPVYEAPEDRPKPSKRPIKDLMRDRKP